MSAKSRPRNDLLIPLERCAAPPDAQAELLLAAPPVRVLPNRVDRLINY